MSKLLSITMYNLTVSASVLYLIYFCISISSAFPMIMQSVIAFDYCIQTLLVKIMPLLCQIKLMHARKRMYICQELNLIHCIWNVQNFYLFLSCGSVFCMYTFHLFIYGMDNFNFLYYFTVCFIRYVRHFIAKYTQICSHKTTTINGDKFDIVANGAFPPEGVGRFSLQRYGTGYASTAKSGRDPDWAVSSCSSLAVLLRWGSETPERVPVSSTYTHHPLIGWQNRHFRATRG